MNKFPKHIKKKLLKIISSMAQNPDPFVKNPGKDFTRQRLLSLCDTMSLVITSCGGGLSDELRRYFQDNRAIIPTASALIQQRDKILPEAFQHVFKEFTQACETTELYKGYRVLAADGSVLNIAHNPKDTTSYIQSSKEAKGYNQIHLNGFYDIRNKLFIDAFVQPSREKNERKALIKMISDSDLPDKTLVIVDRGYEGYNLVAHLNKKNWKYIVRIKDKASGSIASKLDLPEAEEFDEMRTITLTRKQTKEVKANPHKYRVLPKNVTYDFLDEKTLYHELTFRIVRIKIGEDKYETILTNLEAETFNSDEIKELYGSRWRIETAFRELKHTIGLVKWHSAKMPFIIQEIYAKLTLYNFSMSITMRVEIPKKNRKYEYQVNFTEAIKTCREFIMERKKKKNERIDVEGRIRDKILPIRKGRQAPRHLKNQSFISFNYR